MPIRKTVFANKCFYHIYNRGVAKQKIFLDNEDRQFFLKRIDKYQQKLLSIHCFCLMPNHYHFIVKQINDNGVLFFFHKLGTSYSKYFNLKYKRVGPLFQGRFKAKLINKDEYITHLSRYIHLNPIEFLDKPESLKDYPFTSFSSYVDSFHYDFLDKSFIIGYFDNNPSSYEKYVLENIDKPVAEEIKPYLL